MLTMFGFFSPKNQSSGLTSARYFWEREGRVIWRNKKHTDKRVYYLLGCSSPGVVDSGCHFTSMAKAAGPCRGQEGHRDGYTIPGNLIVGSQYALMACGETMQNKAVSVEESPQLSIPFAPGSAIGDPQEEQRSGLRAGRARVQARGQDEDSILVFSRPSSLTLTKGNDRLGFPSPITLSSPALTL